MDYNEFKEKIKENLKIYMPADYEAVFSKILKANERKDGITIVSKNTNQKETCIPVMYINDIFHKVNNYSDDDVKQIAITIVMKLFNFKESKYKVTFDPEKIIFRVINTERNKEFLKNVPHRDFLDLSIIYVQVINNSNESLDTCTITNEMIEAGNITEDFLYRMAKNNTDKELGTLIKAPYDDEEYINDYDVTYIISNKNMINGAYKIFDIDSLDKMADELNSDLIIIPSSVHEILVTRYEDSKAKFYSDLVIDTNANILDNRDYLSDSLYIYNKDNKEISIYEKESE